MSDTQKNPWVIPFKWNGSTVAMEHCDAESRIAEIKRSEDVAWLRLVLAWKDSQISVRVAAQRRLRKLSKGGRR